MCNRKKLLIITMMMFSNGAFAENVAEQIKQTNENVAVLSARLAEMEVRAKIAAKQQEIDRLGGQTAASPSDQPLPVVRSIEGANGRMQAVLATGGGATQMVVKGDQIGEWTINKIDVNSVFLAKGKQIVRLGFGTEPPVSPASPTTQGGIAPPGFR